MQKWIHEPSDGFLILGDYNCNYNGFPYEVDSDIEIVIKGKFPYARYMSFTVRGEADRPIVSVPDRDLTPDPGSTNPFLPGADWNADNRNYTLRIRFTAPPKGSNHFVPEAGNNTIYAGTFPDGSRNRQGIIVLRIYVPSIGYDKTGGVGLPEITYCSPTKDKRHTKNIETFNQTAFFENPLNSKNNYDKYKQYSSTNKMDNGQNCDLTWRTLGIGTEFLSPDPNTVYIISDQIQRDPGKLLFIRWKAPTFPDTYQNIGILGNEDMRYWSMSFITRVGLLGLYTLGDFQAIIDKKGYVNLVISFGASRPSFVTTENGFTWIDTSHLPLVPFSLFYRNNQVSQGFPYTAKDISEGQMVPPKIMGEYYPCAKYVSPQYLNSSCCNDHNEQDKRNS